MQRGSPASARALAKARRKARLGAVRTLARSAGRAGATRVDANEIVVVGAGMSGLAAALLLSRRGHAVRVWERAEKPGGLAGTETFRGVPCDLGSHRLHPDALSEPLLREMLGGHDFLDRPRRGALVLGGRHVRYPPDAISLARALGPTATASMALGLLARPKRRAAYRGWEEDRRGAEEDVGFAQFVSERVGTPALDAFYRPYAEKVWGLSAEELSQTVAKKRFSGAGPWSAVRGAARRVGAGLRGQGHEAQQRYAYPRAGMGSIVEFLRDELARRDVRIELGRPFDVDQRDERTVLYSGNLTDLVSTDLEHRGVYLVYLALPVAQLAQTETYYSHDPKYFFSRVSELGNYSPDLKNPGETILCVEIPEGAWGRGVAFHEGGMLRELCRQLEHAGIVPPGVSPLEVRQRFVPRVYPLYRRGWFAEWKATLARVGELGNVFPFGRQALFLHCNLDHCANIARDVVEHVHRRGTSTEWLARVPEYVHLRVRD